MNSTEDRGDRVLRDAVGITATRHPIGCAPSRPWPTKAFSSSRVHNWARHSAHCATSCSRPTRENERVEEFPIESGYAKKCRGNIRSYL